MSIIKSLPSTMQEIRWNFKGSEGQIADDERYVRDMRQLAGDDEWDLLQYDGAAYGLQYAFRIEDWSTHGDIYLLDKSLSDKRIDGAISYPQYNFAFINKNRLYLKIRQESWDMTPGAVGNNGWWYADEVNSAKYRIKATLGVGDQWESDAYLGMFVLGYRNGYLDGSRVTYVKTTDYFNKNTSRDYEREFTVDPNYRHVVVNFVVWQPGGYRRRAESQGYVTDVTIERVE